MDAEVRVLAVWDGKLVAGGYFHMAGGNPCNLIAVWDGTEWTALGSGMGPPPPGALHGVLALTVWNDQLVAGGYFVTAGDTECNNIALWNGSRWEPLGGGMNGTVWSLTSWDGLLVASGNFISAGGVVCNGVAAWDGLSWRSLAGGIGLGTYSSSVGPLTVWDGQLAAVGGFSGIGSVSYNNIVLWDGSSWHALGSGITGASYDFYDFPFVSALLVWKGQLLAAGGFLQAGGRASAQFGLWGPVGDVDRDGVVDVSDVIETVNAFGSVPGQPNWNAGADNDGNGIVDVFDIIATVTNFGTGSG